jgi:hypothetical protein
VSSEHALTLDDAPLPAPLLAVLAPALAPPATEGDVADVFAAAGVLDPLEHAAADMVTNKGLAAVNTVGNRTASPSFRRSTVASAT